MFRYYYIFMGNGVLQVTTRRGEYNLVDREASNIARRGELDPKT